MAMVRFTSIPISVAAPLSSDTASIACPTFVLLIKEVSATIIAIQEMIVTIVTLEMVKAPSASFRFGNVTTEVN